MKMPMLATLAAVALVSAGEESFSPYETLSPLSPAALLSSRAAERSETLTTSGPASGEWVIDWVRCPNFPGASDDERTSTAMFYYGYFTAGAHVRVVDTAKISDNPEKVMQRCSGMPSLTVGQAFREALIGK